MFEFGRDLRKLFAQARESEDLSWLELIGVDLLAIEARQQTTDAGRVSCARPHAARLRASALWREHARRTGAVDSLDRAIEEAEDAARLSRSTDETARAAVEKALALLLRFDLCGGRQALDRAAEAVPGSGGACRPATVAAIACVHARVRARQARLSDNPAALLDAAALLDVAIHGLEGRPPCESDDIRMDRAALALEAGVTQRDPHLLDQAGRELQRLVQAASPDYRPLTRARALTLCGAGLAALAALADDTGARDQGRAMFDAAADQFTPDHSPLDWVVIQIVRAGTPGAVSLATLRQVEALTAGQGLVLGAVGRELLLAEEIANAAIHGDMTALTVIETGLRRRLMDRTGPASGLEWAVDQIAMARIAAARAGLTVVRVGVRSGVSGLALIEAAEAAREHGAMSIADRAEGLMRGLAVGV